MKMSKRWGAIALLYTMMWLQASHFSCERFIDVGVPKNQIVTNEIFGNDDAATSAVKGIYSRMVSAESGFASGGLRSITALAGLSSDEFANYSNDAGTIEFSSNSLLSSNAHLRTFIWREAYQYIYTANTVLKNLQVATGVSENTRKQLSGEARFIRAFCYFYLVNLFGDIPLHLTTDYKAMSQSVRIPQAEIYQQIVSDLTEAASLLPTGYATQERVRPNHWTARALLARVFMYQEKWEDAEQEASSVIAHTGLYNLTQNPGEAFLKNNQEAIWQVMPATPGRNTNEANLFILTTIPNRMALNQTLIQSFEENDTRLRLWTGSLQANNQTYFFPFKYKAVTGSDLSEYSVVLRLAEQYLIRAEARAHQQNLQGAISDLNTIRQRAGLPSLSLPLSQQQCLEIIALERRHELFSEWGHRWFDLKRTGAIDSVMQAAKVGLWQHTDRLYPIPQSEINANRNISQNEGY